MKADPDLADVPLVISTSDPSRAPSEPLIMKRPMDLSRLLAALARFF